MYNSYTETGVNIQDYWSILDIGDITPPSVADAISVVQDIIAKHIDLELKIFLGGDHTITYLALKALKQLSGSSWGLIYFDAHPDLYERYDGDRYSHACTVRRIIEKSLVDPENIIQVGIRAATAQQLSYVQNADIKLVSTVDVCEMPGKKIAAMVKETLCHVEQVYVSFDVDVLDPAFAPGVGNPEGGGVTLRKLIDIIQHLDKLQIRAFDVVETTPDYDCAGITFVSTSKLIREMLGILASS
jgi:agmatinase